ncbi:hypothetical protein LJC60_03280 [Ruminococcaceae bacterium OttesenSCG-928-D13]|nr:hypothetical protein [Ruminococcaceae bacterium OttesenSCG-928-D13]
MCQLVVVATKVCQSGGQRGQLRQLVFAAIKVCQSGGQRGQLCQLVVGAIKSFQTGRQHGQLCQLVVVAIKSFQSGRQRGQMRQFVVVAGKACQANKVFNSRYTCNIAIAYLKICDSRNIGGINRGTFCFAKLAAHRCKENGVGEIRSNIGAHWLRKVALFFWHCLCGLCSFVFCAGFSGSLDMVEFIHRGTGIRRRRRKGRCGQLHGHQQGQQKCRRKAWQIGFDCARFVCFHVPLLYSSKICHCNCWELSGLPCIMFMIFWAASFPMACCG